MVFHKEALYLLAITGLAAMLVAASNVGPTDGTSIAMVYLYWLVRLLIGALLFVGIRELIEKASPDKAPMIVTTGLAIVLSLAPFTLAITAFDIVLGFPELGLESGSQGNDTRISEFAFELVYQFDNHVALCLLLALPRVMVKYRPVATSTSTTLPDDVRPVGFLDTLDPPLEGDIIWAEAQEHYVRLSTTEENRMVLHRFADILRDLPEEAGIRVHRSHWVSFSAIADVHRDGSKLQLKLCNGETVPVSRTYKRDVETALEDKTPAT